MKGLGGYPGRLIPKGYDDKGYDSSDIIHYDLNITPCVYKIRVKSVTIMHSSKQSALTMARYIADRYNLTLIVQGCDQSYRVCPHLPPVFIPGGSIVEDPTTSGQPSDGKDPFDPPEQPSGGGTSVSKPSSKPASGGEIDPGSSSAGIIPEDDSSSDSSGDDWSSEGEWVESPKPESVTPQPTSPEVVESNGVGSNEPEQYDESFTVTQRGGFFYDAAGDSAYYLGSDGYYHSVTDPNSAYTLSTSSTGVTTLTPASNESGNTDDAFQWDDDEYDPDSNPAHYDESNSDPDEQTGYIPETDDNDLSSGGDDTSSGDSDDDDWSDDGSDDSGWGTGYYD